jgi:glycosyltransferase involved in cell wall biosynthesis
MNSWIERLGMQRFFFAVVEFLHIPYNPPFPENYHTGKTLLLLEDAIPAPHIGAGFPRSYKMLLTLAEIGFHVTLFPLINKNCKGSKELQIQNIEILCGSHLDFLRFAKERFGYYKVVVVSRPHNFQNVREIIRTYFPDAYLVYDAEALFSIRKILKEKLTGVISSSHERNKLIQDEIDLMRSADCVLAVSKHELQIIREQGYQGKINIWGYPVTPYHPISPFSERKGILFVGSFLARESPNEDAILYFLSSIFPRIQDIAPCPLCIAGYNLPASVQKYSSSTITVVGHVKDLAPFYQKYRVFIVPHRYSAGIPLKLLEAMSQGLPSVVSPLIAEQLGVQDGNEVLVAENSEDFAEAICKIYHDETLWNRVQSNAIRYIQENCDPAVMKDVLSEIMEKNDIQFQKKNRDR